MDKFNRNKQSVRVKIISMGNAETGKVRVYFSMMLGTNISLMSNFNFALSIYVHGVL